MHTSEESKATAVEASERNADSLTVLLVEDEAPIRETLREFLLGRGHEVNVARDGQQAAEFLASERAYDLVLTDLRLPVGDGVEVIRLARARSQSCYVVLMTGFASLESAIEAVRLGAFDYLVKPFSLSELDLALRRITDHRSLSSENQRMSQELAQVRPLRELVEQQAGLRREIQELANLVREQTKLVSGRRD
jgi:DNA-binding NtrC family response regulator